MLAFTLVTGSCCGRHFGNRDWIRVEVRLRRNLEPVADTDKYGELGNTKKCESISTLTTAPWARIDSSEIAFARKFNRGHVEPLRSRQVVGDATL
jgi:hypothetical protein